MLDELAEYPLIDIDFLYKNRLLGEAVVLEVTLKSVNFTTKSQSDDTLGRKYFDIEKFSRQDLPFPLPHMMVNQICFENLMMVNNISHDQIVILYEPQGIYASPRAWWMLKSMGHKKVFILTDNLSECVERNDLETRSSGRENSRYTAQYNSRFFCNMNFIKEALSSPWKYQIVDARSKRRFEGEEKEPREGLLGGHIPYAINLPFTRLLSNGQYVSLERIKQYFKELKLDPDKHIIFTCGSGVTACILALAAYMIGYKNLSVYDGSWSEWGLKELNNPIETGPSKLTINTM